MNMEKACRLGNLKAIKELVAENPDVVNEVDEKIGWTPLYRTVICSHVDATKLLIKLGANPNIQNKLGEAPIHKAADSALPRIVKILLDAQADPNLQTNDGETPLHLATLRQNAKMIRLLLKSNANPNVKNHKLGQTPLHYAVDLGNIQIVEMMISFDASPLIRDRSEKTAMDLATMPEVQRALVEPPKEQIQSPTDVVREVESEEEELVDRIPESDEEDAPPTPFLKGAMDVESDELAPPPPPLQEASSNASSPGRGIRIWDKKHSDEPEPQQAGDAEIEVETPGGNLQVQSRTDMSFGEAQKAAETEKESNPILLTWLTANKLEELYDPLINAGYDDIELMAEQMKSNMPITMQTLQKIGVQKPGHRARLLAKLTDETIAGPGARKRKSVNPGAARPGPSRVFECCSVPAPAPAFYTYPHLKDWLESISLGSLYQTFVNAGYDDYEEILYLMNTGYPLTDMVLENDVGIVKMGHRQRILLKLQQDMNTMGDSKKKGVSMEKEGKTSACETCLLM